MPATWDIWAQSEGQAGLQPARDGGEEWSLGKEQDGRAGDMKSAGTGATFAGLGRWRRGEARGRLYVMYCTLELG